MPQELNEPSPAYSDAANVCASEEPSNSCHLIIRCVSYSAYFLKYKNNYYLNLS